MIARELRSDNAKILQSSLARELEDGVILGMSMAARLRLRLFPRAETAIRRGHPWVYADSIKNQNREGELGELAVIYDRNDCFMALGLYDPGSPIRVRIVHLGKAATVDRAWWRERMMQCRQARMDSLWSDATTGLRMINGESEGFPGFVVDRYAETLVVKIYTAAWLPRWDEMEALIREVLGGRFLVLRMSRNIQQQAKKDWGLLEGFRGEVGDDVVVFRENGIYFEAAVRDGQKTGFFLDQRENRARVEALAANRDVLNVFSFSGAFSVYAARGGAKSVTDLDISAHALASAERNFGLNKEDLRIANVPRHQVQADAFEWMDQDESRYDLIIVDPPSLAKRESEREGALRAYERLNRRAIEKLRPGGVLVSASCSAHVSAEEFHAMLTKVGEQSRRPWKECWRSDHAQDHPATYAEAHYLKAACLAFDEPQRG